MKKLILRRDACEVTAFSVQMDSVLVRIGWVENHFLVSIPDSIELCGEPDSLRREGKSKHLGDSTDTDKDAYTPLSSPQG